MMRFSGIGTSLIVLLLAMPVYGQDMELSDPEMSDFGDESQAADLGNDMVDRATITDESQAADVGNDMADRADITDESQAADLGNDMADRADITDESQAADLSGESQGADLEPY